MAGLGNPSSGQVLGGGNPSSGQVLGGGPWEPVQRTDSGWCASGARPANRFWGLGNLSSGQVLGGRPWEPVQRTGSGRRTLGTRPTDRFWAAWTCLYTYSQSKLTILCLDTLAEEAGFNQSLKKLPMLFKRIVATTLSTEPGDVTFADLVNFLSRTESDKGLEQNCTQRCLCLLLQWMTPAVRMRHDVKDSSRLQSSFVQAMSPGPEATKPHKGARVDPETPKIANKR